MTTPPPIIGATPIVPGNEPIPCPVINAIERAISIMDEAASTYSVTAMYEDDYSKSLDAQIAILRSLIDPENQPNQYGVVIPARPAASACDADTAPPQRGLAAAIQDAARACEPLCVKEAIHAPTRAIGDMWDRHAATLRRLAEGK